MSDAATKTCSKCGDVKAFDAFKKIGMQCKSCLNEMARKRYEINPERVAANSKKWRQANPEKVIANYLKWEQGNRDKRVAKQKEWAIKNRRKRAQQQSKRDGLLRKNLAESYLRNIVSRTTGIEYAVVPQALIEVKRKHLQILRKLKEKPNEQQSKNP